MISPSILLGFESQDGTDIGFIDRLVVDYIYMLSRHRGILPVPSIPGAAETRLYSLNLDRYQTDLNTHSEVLDDG